LATPWPTAASAPRVVSLEVQVLVKVSVPPAIVLVYCPTEANTPYYTPVISPTPEAEGSPTTGRVVMGGRAPEVEGVVVMVPTADTFSYPVSTSCFFPIPDLMTAPNVKFKESAITQRRVRVLVFIV